MKVTIVNIDNWGYNKYIKLELERKGIAVTFIDLDKQQYKYPTLFHKTFNFVSKLFFDYNLKREHLNKILVKKLKTLEKQDAILVIKGDFLCANSFRFLNSKTENLIAYFNDSFKRYPRMKKIHSFFDTVYSFEPKDVKKCNFNLITNYIYFDLKRKHDKKKSPFQVFNISSLDKRDAVMPKIAAFLKSQNISYKLIAFSQKQYPDLEELNIEVSNTIYSQDAVFKMTQEASIVLDLQRPNQEGLSFRVFEALGLEKKIITTNKSIKNYDFYHPNNIAIIDSDAIEIPASFFSTPYEKLDAEIVKKYHVSSWVNQVFGLG